MKLFKVFIIKSGYCLLLLYLFSCKIMFAQIKPITALPQLLAKTKNVKEKIDILNDYADTLCLHKNDTGKALAQTALNLSKTEEYHIGIGDASHSLGLIQFRRNNDSALFYFKQAKEEYLKEYPGIEKYAFTLNNISRTYHEMLLPDSSLHYGRLALEFINSSKEQQNIKLRWQMFTYGAIANSFSIESRYDSANFYYHKAITSAEMLKNNKMLEVYFKGLSGIQALLGNYDKAIFFGKKAITYIENDDRALTFALASLGSHYLRVGDLANAELMADSSLKVGIRCNAENSIGRNYTTLGSIKMHEEKYLSALQYFKTGLKKATAGFNSKHSISILYHKTGNVYQILDSIPEAEYNYLKALNIAAGDKEIVRNIYYSLSKLFENKGEFSKAYNYLKRYNQFNDSFYTSEKLKIISELNTRYETEKKDQQLLFFQKDKELKDALVYKQMQQIEQAFAEQREQELEILNFRLESVGKEQVLKIKELDLENSKAKEKEQKMALLNATNKLEIEQKQKGLNMEIVKRQRIWFILLFTGFTVLGLVFHLLFNRYKLRKKLQEQNNLNEQKQRISRNLHDEIGSTLSGIAMYSHLVKNNLENNNTEGAKHSVNIIQKSATLMVTKLNDIVWLINPQKESMEELIERLREFALNMCAAKHITPHIQMYGSVVSYKPSIEKRNNIFLFCKEAINNAVKYSNAKSLVLKFILQDKSLEISIEDDGDGFNIDTIKKGNGLDNMQKRATEMNALFSIHSTVNKGCSINLKITH